MVHCRQLDVDPDRIRRYTALAAGGEEARAAGTSDAVRTCYSSVTVYVEQK
jgi:hypothetical protein